ncbi:MAG: formylglycine-generating enzyme family protein, partial [Pseudomonadota bacterium]
GSRFDDAADFVRIEVEAALADPSTTVIPVLLDGAKAPTETALPGGLKPLARRQFARLSHEGYRAEIGVLTDAVDRALGAAVPAAPPRRSRKPLMAALGVLAALAAGAAAVAFRPPAGLDRSGEPDFARFADCDGCPEMIVLPGGAYDMGSPPDEPDRGSDEGPREGVAIPRFAMARTETTRGEYLRCVDAGACELLYDSGGADDMPATNMRLVDAEAYAAWLNGLVGGPVYRVPSEAEWEYAARAGSTSAFPWGDAFDPAHANLEGVEGADEWEELAPAGALEPNAWGLHDMIGNQWEWTADVYASDLEDGPRDGSAWIIRSDTIWGRRHAIRGGAYNERPGESRSAARQSNDRERANYNYGFRLARDLSPRE